MLGNLRTTSRQWSGGLPRPTTPWHVVNVVLLVAVAAAGVTADFVTGEAVTAAT